MLAVPPTTVPEYQIILNVEPGGMVIFSGDRIPIEEISRELALEVKSAAREGVYDAGDISVVIRSHEDTETGTVQDLISVCQNVKLESFALRVLNKVN